MQNLPWDDLRLFLQVARAGGLTGAAAATATSAATLGRRMLALEAALKRSLFVRRQTGYRLTADGEDLFARVQAMEAQARPIEDWAAGPDAMPTVRISPGTWTGNFLAENFAALWRPADRFRIAFTLTEARMDIAHREVDIGIRNSEPEAGNLAVRRGCRVAYAGFRARSAPEAAARWVAIQPELALPRHWRWPVENRAHAIVAWASNPRILADLMRAGIGTGVVPCFTGDRDPALVRDGPPIPELWEEQYIVMHDDDRHRPEIRTVIDRLARLFEAHAPLFAGERPIGAA
jgi:DNA-binding transcriptional LysR family regulator